MMASQRGMVFVMVDGDNPRQGIHRRHGLLSSCYPSSSPPALRWPSRFPPTRHPSSIIPHPWNQVAVVSAWTSIQDMKAVVVVVVDEWLYPPALPRLPSAPNCIPTSQTEMRILWTYRRYMGWAEKPSWAVARCPGCRQRSDEPGEKRADPRITRFAPLGRPASWRVRWRPQVAQVEVHRATLEPCPCCAQLCS